jgi:hypothetical protein
LVLLVLIKTAQATESLTNAAAPLPLAAQPAAEAPAAAQTPAAAAAPAPEGGVSGQGLAAAPAVDSQAADLSCFDWVTNVFFVSCSITLDRLSLQFSRGSSQRLTEQQLDAGVKDLVASGLPVNR